MLIVTVKSGLYRNQEISGDFPYVSQSPGDASCKRQLYLRVLKNGKEVNIHVNESDYQVIDKTLKQTIAVVPFSNMSEEDIELDRRIQQRFEIMSKLTEFAIAGHVRSMIISGAAGIGKTYNLETRLNKAIDKCEINRFTVIKGKISAIQMFKQLFEHREKGDILVFDDIDGIFEDETSLNLLKGALDTGDTRTLSWLTAASWLEENGVDQVFNFEGSCIFITNLDFDRMLERGTNLAVHFRALISRSTYLDLGIHENREILMRIKWVVNNTSMLDVHGIDDHQKQLMMQWMTLNHEHMRELSLRTILKLAAFMNGDPKGWQDIAEATMLKNTGFTIAQTLEQQALGTIIAPRKVTEGEEELVE